MTRSWLDPGITGRLVLALTAASALVFVVVFYTNYQYTAGMVERQVQAHSRDVVMSAVQSIDDLLSGVARDANNLVATLERAPQLTARQVHDMARNHVVINDEVFGSTVAFEPGMTPASEGLFAPYYYRRLNGSIAFVDLALPSYNYPARDWYLQPRELKAPVWSEPYFDEGGGNVVMTTYAAPFYRSAKDGRRRLAGIATADISVDWLGRQVSSLRLYRNGFAVLFSRKGVYLAHPDRSLVLKENISTVAEKAHSPVLDAISNGIKRQETGFVKARTLTGQDSWIYYAPVPSTGWSLAVIFSAEAMLADVYRSSRVIALSCAAGFLLLVLTIVLVARTVTKPLVAMTEAVDLIAEGRLDIPLPEQSGGEVGQLARAFAGMQHDLQSYIARLTEATAARERMASELEIATQIQHSFLPHQLPRLPGISLAGCCLPAREVGGDFYDLIDLEDGRLFLVIGDVSGKGVPAALYMAATVTLVRALAREQFPPDQLLQRLNSELALTNDASMFVTLFCGYLITATGELQYANAGHNPPLLKRYGKPPLFHPIIPGLPAGCIEEYEYRADRLTLEPGDTLLLYTDGVTEAQDSNGSFFGEQQLLDVVHAVAGSAESHVDQVRVSVDRFAAGVPQADDITMLALCFKADVLR